jgi:hypothetical protein
LLPEQQFAVEGPGLTREALAGQREHQERAVLAVEDDDWLARPESIFGVH